VASSVATPTPTPRGGSSVWCCRCCFWPIGDGDVENQMLEQFVALAFTEQG
jgi:hypothetical protein